MKLPKNIKQWDTIEIKWVDSTHGSGWEKSDPGDIEHAEKQLDHRTSGYFYQEGKRSITVVQSLGDYKRENGSRSIDSTMNIPHSAIQSIRKLK